ncbi:MAG TPA: stage V sporulation protein AE [Bacillota bacterium]|nr:stage V sporulation protein AE [Bacillota bacterium]HOR85750.1 stage V sporulation protein AE [Bacillota bacterium]HPL53316.1 stage V sporulation protein AE [Bacillota bacterium]
MNGKRQVILVTDGDRIAKKAVEAATLRIGGRCISKSAGNPTPMSGQSIVKLIKETPYDPVVVMVDDRGHMGTGNGEMVIRDIARCPEVEILGVIAVASNTEGVEGTRIDSAITRDGNIIAGTVDKYGNKTEGNRINGDTVDILESIEVPVIIGIGDPGKMKGKDCCDKGAPIITKAMKEIIKRSSMH